MSAPITISQLNMQGENWREFRKGYTRNDPSDAPAPTTIAKDQILSTRLPAQAKLALDQTKNTSLLGIVDGAISPVAMHLEAGTALTSTMFISGFNVAPTITPSTLGLVITGDYAMVISSQNSASPVTTYVTWNFSDIKGYDSRRVDFAFIRASVEVRAGATGIPLDKDIATMDYGGGLYMDLFNTGTMVPLYSGGYLSGRTFLVPVNPYQQTSLKLMSKGCYNWSIQFLAITTGA